MSLVEITDNLVVRIEDIKLIKRITTDYDKYNLEIFFKDKGVSAVTVPGRTEHQVYRIYNKLMVKY